MYIILNCVWNLLTYGHLHPTYFTLPNLTCHSFAYKPRPDSLHAEGVNADSYRQKCYGIIWKSVADFERVLCSLHNHKFLILETHARVLWCRYVSVYLAKHYPNVCQQIWCNQRGTLHTPTSKYHPHFDNLSSSYSYVQ